jgi:hypothetical protein
MALPLLVGLGVRAVAQYTMRYGIPAAKQAYKAYLKKNPAMKKKIKGTMTDFFKKDSIVSAGAKFAKAGKKTKTRKTNTPRTSKKTTTDKKTRSQKAFDKGASMTQAERNKSVRGTVGKVVGVGTAGALVYEAAKGIRASSTAKADAAKAKAEAAKRKRDADKKKAEKKADKKTTSAPSRRIDNTADYSRASSDYRSRGTGSKSSRDAKAKAKRPSYFQDIDAKEKKKKDTGGVRTRFGGRVTTRSGNLRTRGN